ncbi:MAG: hypothetical protein KF784_04810 [Fimbriimonadaceae bacterium]|nr:hypothetical protein [Fimbriimonadaceae bacterium]
MLALIISGILFAMRRQVDKPQAPTPVNVADPAYPTGDVVYTNGLPGANSSGSGGAGSPGMQANAPAGGGGAAGGRSRPSLGVSGG